MTPTTTSEIPVPSSEECILGAAAYASLFMGPFILGPIALYYLKRQSSPFVTRHAVQAVGVGVMMVVATAFSGLAYLGAMAVGMLLGSAIGMEVALVMSLMVLVVFAVTLPAIFAAVAAWRAFHAKHYCVPLVARAVDRMFPVAAASGLNGT